MPKNPKHSLVTLLVQGALSHALPAGWHVRGQEPVTTEDSEPEFDIIVARGELRQYLGRHPGPQDVALIVEVADSSLQRDRMLKKRLYAAAGIPIHPVKWSSRRIVSSTTMELPMQYRSYLMVERSRVSPSESYYPNAKPLQA